MSDIKVVLPTTTEEWQRDMNIAYQQGRADATKELPTSLYCDGFNDGYSKGRADAERDFQNSDYWNDYLAKVIKDAKADAIDDVLFILYDKGYINSDDEDYVREQLKE